MVAEAATVAKASFAQCVGVFNAESEGKPRRRLQDPAVPNARVRLLRAIEIVAQPFKKPSETAQNPQEMTVCKAPAAD